MAHSGPYDSKAQGWDNKTKKLDYYDNQKREQEKKNNKKNDYGAWGSTFKNKENFASMHHC